jgi:hypothetical protein
MGKHRRINRCNPLIIRGKWTNETLEEAIDVVENGITSLKKVKRHWNIPLTSLSNHLYGNTRSKKLGLTSMLIVKEDQIVVAWVLFMHEVELLINFQ